MVKFLKPGKIVVILRGKYAGRKAVIMKSYDDGTRARTYGHCVVAGVERYPLKVTRLMSKKKVARRSRVVPFVKVVNYNHMMPTRYALDGVDVKKAGVAVTTDVVKDATQKKELTKSIRKQFEEHYQAGKAPWFFQKLRF